MTAAEKSGVSRQQWQDMLDFLGPTPEQAGVRYEEIRRRLIRIFVWRGCCEPEDLADETIDRVARKCGAIADTYVGDPAHYFGGVARKVFLESVRKGPTPLPMPELEPSELEAKEVRHRILDECMRLLTKKHRLLVLEYYRGEKGAKIENRRQLAELHGKSRNALRIHVHRLVNIVRDCVFEKQKVAAE